MKKLYRSRRDKKLFGLCGGIAEMLNVDATLLRILLIVLTVFTSGALIVVYILAGLVVPKEPIPYNGFGPGGFGPGPGGYGSGNYNNGGWNNGGGYYSNPGQGPGYNGSYTNTNPNPNIPPSGPQRGSANWQQGQPASNLDAMMEELEIKALRREIDELKAKLAKQEKGEF
ncbi:PspC domain-containing protein [Paenibacillus sepulcri]|uniref:PspC domain-containing protein n=1 Tax=Paenibacillus sepulcri TaxID=359917 RepID=A0ABS7C627_9BACL|nr:PspC domain-containing protein [Paenibacillus sepulcri]